MVGDSSECYWKSLKKPIFPNKYGLIKIDYETPPPFCPKPLFAQPRPEEPQEPQARHGAAQVDLQGLDSVPSIRFLRLSTFPGPSLE